jgi:hypothetical protein
MKKLLLILLAIVFFGSFFSTQLAFAVVPAPVSLETAQTRTLVGKVKYVSLGNELIGSVPRVVIMVEKGKILSLEVKSGTIIYDKTGKAIALDKIKIGDKVVIEYIETKEIIEKAESIKLTE